MKNAWLLPALLLALAGLAAVSAACSDPCGEDCDSPSGVEETPTACSESEVWYLDSDVDGYGNAAVTANCEAVESLGGYVPQAGDCDDANATINPGAIETCDSIDDNCDDEVDEGFDDDGDGTSDCIDDDADGVSEDVGDCDDTDVAIHLDATELCDGVDNNCDGQVDEGFDADGDGHNSFAQCGEFGGDCRDDEPAIHPDATETCNLIDDDCDGQDDEGVDVDRDGYTIPGSGGCYATDCDDADPAIHPAATEVCGDGIDQDCSGADTMCLTTEQSDTRPGRRFSPTEVSEGH